MVIGVQLYPVDTWFFRDSTPFTLGAAPQENVKSLFPPHPLTVVGALRMSLASGKGWNGYERWSKDICKILGDGPDDLGALSLDGPFLLRNGKPLFRTPRHLLGLSRGTCWSPSAFLRPGAPVACDLGSSVRLPDVVRSSHNADLKTGDSWWLTSHGLSAVLNGTLPSEEDVVPEQCLWLSEPRIGLARRVDTRTALDGMLYSTEHVRLRSNVSLGVRIAGLPAGWTPPFGQLLTLGGERRLAECEQWKSTVEFKVPWATIRATGEFVAVALSPLELAHDTYTGVESLNDLGNAHVVSACLDRPQRIGGWNSLERQPLAVRSVLPPGSTLFCKTADPSSVVEAATAGNGMVRIGTRQEWGFGLVAIGVLPSSDVRLREEMR